MTKAWTEKEIYISTKNETGSLAKVIGPLAEAKVNVWAICGWTEGDNSNFAFITDNNTKATELLTTAGYTPTENEVVVTELEDKPGTLWTFSQAITNAGVNGKYMYVSTCGGCPTTRLVINTDNNTKALETLKTI